MIGIAFFVGRFSFLQQFEHISQFPSGLQIPATKYTESCGDLSGFYFATSKLFNTVLVSHFGNVIVIGFDVSLFGFILFRFFGFPMAKFLFPSLVLENFQPLFL